jgi:hypothetical protein
MIISRAERNGGKKRLQPNVTAKQNKQIQLLNYISRSFMKERKKFTTILAEDRKKGLCPRNISMPHRKLMHNLKVLTLMEEEKRWWPLCRCALYPLSIL